MTQSVQGIVPPCGRHGADRSGGRERQDRFYPVGFDVTVQTATKFEAFLRVFQRKNPSRTAKIARVSALECDFRKLQYTPSTGRVLQRFDRLKELLYDLYTRR